MPTNGPEPGRDLPGKEPGRDLHQPASQARCLGQPASRRTQKPQQRRRILRTHKFPGTSESRQTGSTNTLISESETQPPSCRLPMMTSESQRWIGALNSPARRSVALVAHGGGSTCAARSSSKARSIGARLRADAEVPAQPHMAFGAASSPRPHDVSRWGNPYEKGRGHWRDNPTEIARSCWDGGASTTPSMQVGGGHLAEPETA